MKFVIFVPIIFSNYGSTCDLTDFQLQFMIEKRRLDYARHSTISQSRAISSQRPKCVNLAPAGTNAYETLGNRRVKFCEYVIELRMEVALDTIYSP